MQQQAKAELDDGLHSADGLFTAQDFKKILSLTKVHSKTVRGFYAKCKPEKGQKERDEKVAELLAFQRNLGVPSHLREIEEQKDLKSKHLKR